MKPFAESCQQNRDPILEVLRIELAGKSRLLEIGSGTGQHAVYFAPEFPRLVWQTSDVAEMHGGIQAWLDEARLANVLAPLTLLLYLGALESVLDVDLDTAAEGNDQDSEHGQCTHSSLPVSRIGIEEAV